MSPDQSQQETLISEASTARMKAGSRQTEPELSGQLLNGRYKIEKELKRGGFGSVYLARDQQLHSRPVVVKVLLEEAFQHNQHDRIVSKFRQEAEALSRIDHPGIVGIIDVGELADGKPFLVMQYVDGVTLRSVITPEGMNFERAAALLKQIGRALAAAHDKGILHRDLKPENIMLRDLGHGEEQVKIIDFGIAKVRNSLLAPSTSTSSISGTIAYMAPEQLTAKPVSVATDIHAFGSIAYEMLTGRRPFNPETGFQLLEMLRAGVRVKPSDLRPSLPEDAQAIILKALSFEPADRYQNARELGDALSRALQAEADTLELRIKESRQLAPTELSFESLSPAPQPADQSSKTIAARYEPAPLPTPKGAVFPAGFEIDEPRRGRPWLKILAIALVVVVLAAGAYVLIAKRGSPLSDTGNNPATPLPERSLEYSLTVQKMRYGKPYQEQFESSGQEIFENGWKFRMNINSPEEGYLYLLNEGPAASGQTTYNLLFPEAKSNGGSARVTADQKLQTAWMRFVENPGTEKFWIVWAASPVKELEDVTGAVNARQQGEISDAVQAKAVHDFLDQRSSPKPAVAKDSQKKLTTVKAKGDTLVSFVELEHH